MGALSLANVRTGLESALQAISGLYVYKVVPQQPNFPAAIIEPPERVSYVEANARGTDLLSTSVLLLVGRANDVSAQNALDLYIAGTGSKSIKAALEADRTLDGNCSTLVVTEARDFAPYTVNATECLGVRFFVDIWS